MSACVRRQSGRPQLVVPISVGNALRGVPSGKAERHGGRSLQRGGGTTFWGLGAVLALGLIAGPARAAETGSITGTVDRPELVAAVTAVDRTSGDKDKKHQGK